GPRLGVRGAIRAGTAPLPSLERTMTTDVRPARARRTKLPPEQPSIPQRKGGSGGYWLYLLPGFVLLLIIVIIPLGWNVYLTFTEWRGVRSPEFIGLDNWVEIFGDDAFWTSFINPVWLVLAMVVPPADPPRRRRGHRDRLDRPPRRRRRAEPDPRCLRLRPRGLAGHHALRAHRAHGRHGVGAAGLPHRRVHGRAPAGRPRAVRGGR